MLSAADKYKIPVYGSEEEQVKNGCLASVSIDYVALGKVTGRMGVDVIGGEDITKMAVKTITDATPIVNTDVLETLGMTYSRRLYKRSDSLRATDFLRRLPNVVDFKLSRGFLFQADLFFRLLPWDIIYPIIFLIFPI